jgi:CBS domain-containing protein
MKDILIKDLMVPRQEYVTIPEDATLYEAVVRLDQAQADYFKHAAGTERFPHRAILVLDSDGSVVGKLSQLDILKALEPKYKSLFSSGNVSRIAEIGLSQQFLRDMLSAYSLFDKPLHEICKKSTLIKVKDCMYAPEENEVVKEDDSLELAVHHFVLGRHQSLLVTDKNKKILGILRLVDVFREVAEAIKECKVDFKDVTRDLGSTPTDE